MSGGKDLDVEAAQKRCDAATPGPWAAYERRSEDGDNWPVIRTLAPGHLAVNLAETYGDSNAAFIVHSRTDLPLALARIRELEAERDELKALMIAQPAIWIDPPEPAPPRPKAKRKAER